MQALQHKRPIWFGLICCALITPFTFSLACGIAALPLGFFGFAFAALSTMLLFPQILALSGLVTLLCVWPATLFLKHTYRLGAPYLWLIGCLLGCVMCLFFLVIPVHVPGTSHPHTRTAMAPTNTIMMILCAAVGCISTHTLCRISGIPIFPIKRGQASDKGPRERRLIRWLHLPTRGEK